MDEKEYWELRKRKKEHEQYIRELADKVENAMEPGKWYSLDELADICGAYLMDVYDAVNELYYRGFNWLIGKYKVERFETKVVIKRRW